MSVLLSAKLLAIFAPFIAPFVLEGHKSWLGWLFIILLLLMIGIPSIAIPIIVSQTEKEPDLPLEKIMVAEIILAILYIIFWIVGIVFAFTRYKCNNCQIIKK